jgi:hypothetical protein
MLTYMTPIGGNRTWTPENDPANLTQVPPNGTVARLLDGRGWLDLEQLGETFEEVQPWVSFLSWWMGMVTIGCFFKTTRGKPGADFFPEFCGASCDLLPNKCFEMVWEVASRKLEAISHD